MIEGALKPVVEALALFPGPFRPWIAFWFGISILAVAISRRWISRAAGLVLRFGLATAELLLSLIMIPDFLLARSVRIAGRLPSSAIFHLGRPIERLIWQLGQVRCRVPRPKPRRGFPVAFIGTLAVAVLVVGGVVIWKPLGPVSLHTSIAYEFWRKVENWAGVADADRSYPIDTEPSAIVSVIRGRAKVVTRADNAGEVVTLFANPSNFAPEGVYVGTAVLNDRGEATVVIPRNVARLVSKGSVLRISISAEEEFVRIP